MMIGATSFSITEKAALRGGLSTELLRELFNRTDQRTPVLVLSQSAIGRNYEALKNALPRVGIHYAVKPNSHPAIIAELARHGAERDAFSRTRLPRRAPYRVAVLPPSIESMAPVTNFDAGLAR